MIVLGRALFIAPAVILLVGMYLIKMAVSEAPLAIQASQLVLLYLSLYKIVFVI